MLLDTKPVHFLSEVNVKVLNFEQFTAMPDGVVFSYYAPCIVHGLYKRNEIIRDDTGKVIDYFEQNLLPECPYTATEHKPELTANSARWACYEFDQLYAVYEEADIDKLIGLLKDK